MRRERALRPVRDPIGCYDAIEADIKASFRRLVYAPVVAELDAARRNVLANAQPRRMSLVEAIETGRVTYDRGRFRGKFSSSNLIDLRDLGARYDKNKNEFILQSQDLPVDVQQAISLSEAKFLQKLTAIDDKLRQILPAEVAGSLKTAEIFDSTLFHIDREIGKTLEDVALIPRLKASQRKRIADDWQNNLELWIKDFAAEQIKALRADIQASALSGNRYEAVIKSIQRSYGVTESRAKFLARQETRLFVAKFKETRYQDAGVRRYRWKCVVGSAAHPVRPAHKALDGTTHAWDEPPVTSEPGQPLRRNNPGTDWNCRCFAVPLVDFRESS